MTSSSASSEATQSSTRRCDRWSRAPRHQRVDLAGTRRRIGVAGAADPERVARRARLQQTEADFDPLPFDAAAARRFGQVAASLRRAGRKPTARSFDAMIAATALARDLPLSTCNPDDVAGIDGLRVITVPQPDG